MMVSAVGPEKKMLHSKMVSPAHETHWDGGSRREGSGGKGIPRNRWKTLVGVRLLPD